jgi:hypothetical protein
MTRFESSPGHQFFGIYQYSGTLSEIDSRSEEDPK